MIDTAKLYYYLTERVLDRLHDQAALSRDGINLYGNKFFLKHPFGYTNPAVFFNHEKREICIETSLPKLLQGHNVFGINRLQCLCVEVASLIYRQLGLSFKSQERHLIKSHGIRLGRLDTTCSFVLQSQRAVKAVLEECWQQFKADGRKWSCDGKDGFETLYNQKHSQRVSDKLYSKYAELLVARHGIRDCVHDRERIMKLAENVLRFEVTWRYKELQRLQLEYADQWNRDRVIAVMMKRLEQLDFQGIIKDRSMVSGHDELNLNKRDQAFCRLWQCGTDLRQVRNYAPAHKARSSLKRHSIDIFRPLGSACRIDIGKLLSVGNARFGRPKGFDSHGC